MPLISHWPSVFSAATQVGDVMAIVLEATALDAARYFATRGFVTAASDVPYDTIFDGRIVSDPDYSRAITTIFWGSGTPKFTLGALDLINADGALNDLLMLPKNRDRQVSIWSGEHGASFATFELIAVAQINEVTEEGTLLRITLADKSAALDRPIQQTLYSSGVLLGQLKPFGFGSCYSVPAPLPNIAFLRYDVLDSSTHTITKVRANGDELTPVTDWINYGNGFELLFAFPGKITAECALSGVSSFGGAVRFLAQKSGLNLGDLDMATADLVPYSYAYWTQNGTTYRQVLQELVDSVGGWYFTDRHGQMHFGRLEAPGAASMQINESDLADDNVRIYADDAPGLTNIATAQRNWHVHSANEVAGVLSGTAIGTQLQQDYRHRAIAGAVVPPSPVDAADREINIGANVDRERAPLKGGAATLLSVPADAQAEVTRWAELYKGRRFFCESSISLSAARARTLEPGTSISINFPRWGFQRECVVVDVRGRLMSGQIRLIVWG